MCDSLTLDLWKRCRRVMVLEELCAMSKRDDNIIRRRRIAGREPSQPATKHKRNTDLKSTQSSILQQVGAAQLDISNRKNNAENLRFSPRAPPLKRSQRHFSTVHGCVRHHTGSYSRPMNDMGCGMSTLTTGHALLGRLGHIRAEPDRIEISTKFQAKIMFFNR